MSAKFGNHPIQKMKTTLPQHLLPDTQRPWLQSIRYKELLEAEANGGSRPVSTFLNPEEAEAIFDRSHKSIPYGSEEERRQVKVWKEAYGILTDYNGGTWGALSVPECEEVLGMPLDMEELVDTMIVVPRCESRLSEWGLCHESFLTEYDVCARVVNHLGKAKMAKLITERQIPVTPANPLIDTALASGMIPVLLDNKIEMLDLGMTWEKLIAGEDKLVTTEPDQAEKAVLIAALFRNSFPA
jgi:hypothetical protein